MNESELVDKLSEVFKEYAKDIQHLEQRELGELTLFLYKIREDIENGKYDTKNKKWSKLQWRNLNL